MKKRKQAGITDRGVRGRVRAMTSARPRASREHTGSPADASSLPRSFSARWGSQPGAQPHARQSRRHSKPVSVGWCRPRYDRQETQSQIQGSTPFPRKQMKLPFTWSCPAKWAGYHVAAGLRCVLYCVPQKWQDNDVSSGGDPVSTCFVLNPSGF